MLDLIKSSQEQKAILNGFITQLENDIQDPESFDDIPYYLFYFIFS